MSSGYEPSCAGDMVGWIIGESTSSHSTILFSPGSIGSVMVGSHVVTYLDGRCVLGVVESIRSGVPLLSADVKDTHSVERLVRDDMEWILDRSRYHHGSVRWVSYVDSLVERGAVDSPKIPPQPVPPPDPCCLSTGAAFWGSPCWACCSTCPWRAATGCGTRGRRITGRSPAPCCSGTTS